MNALMSFLYSLLTTDCVSACEGVGLDPQFGYLHVVRPGKPALALDLMEEFRPCLADRLALSLVNRRQVRQEYLGGTSRRRRSDHAQRRWAQDRSDCVPKPQAGGRAASFPEVQRPVWPDPAPASAAALARKAFAATSSTICHSRRRSLMELLVTYDVNTTTSERRRRLRKVAKICEGHGQRVQLSVFECSLTETQTVGFTNRLVKVIDPTLDSLRIYTLLGSRERFVEVHGRDSFIDFTDALII